MKNLVCIAFSLLLGAPAFAQSVCPAVYTPVCADRKDTARIFNNRCEALTAGFRPRSLGALIAFKIADEEEFWVYTTSNKAIADAKVLLKSGETKVPVMTLKDGASCSGPWTFHAAADSLSFHDATIELCDARPSYIEANKKEWLQTVKVYCPWSAAVVGVYQEPVL